MYRHHNIVNICHHIQKIFFLSWELLRCTLTDYEMCSTVLLTVICMLYITSPWLLFLWACVFVFFQFFFIFDSTYRLEYTLLVCLCFISLNNAFRVHPVVANGKVSCFSYGWVVVIVCVWVFTAFSLSIHLLMGT